MNFLLEWFPLSVRVLHQQEDFTGCQAVGQLQGSPASGGEEDQQPTENFWSSDTCVALKKRRTASD